MKYKFVALLVIVFLLVVTPGLTGAQVCGDFNNDGVVNVTDLTGYVDYLWAGGPGPVNYPSADIDDHEVVTISDAVGLTRTLYLGAGPPTCPPSKPRIKPIPNPNIYLELDKKSFTSYPANEIVQISLVTGSKDFVCLNLPVYFKVGNQQAQVVNVTINSTFGSWSDVGPNYTMNASGSVLFTFAEYMGNALGPFPKSAPEPMATVELHVTSPPNPGAKIKMVWDLSVPPIASTPNYNGSAHYPMMITSAWPLKNVMEVYEPALSPAANIPSLTTWGLITLLILLIGSTAWVVMRRRKAAA